MAWLARTTMLSVGSSVKNVCALRTATSKRSPNVSDSTTVSAALRSTGRKAIRSARLRSTTCTTSVRATTFRSAGDSSSAARARAANLRLSNNVGAAHE